MIFYVKLREHETSQMVLSQRTQQSCQRTMHAQIPLYFPSFQSCKCSFFLTQCTNNYIFNAHFFLLLDNFVLEKKGSNFSSQSPTGASRVQGVFLQFISVVLQWLMTNASWRNLADVAGGDVPYAIIISMHAKMYSNATLHKCKHEEMLQGRIGHGCQNPQARKKVKLPYGNDMVPYGYHIFPQYLGKKAEPMIHPDV